MTFWSYELQFSIRSNTFLVWAIIRVFNKAGVKFYDKESCVSTSKYVLMDNKNRKINKTITQAITDKFTKMKAEEKEALLESLKTNGYKTDEEYRQFILGEVKDSGEYTKEEIGHVERSLREAREAGHGVIQQIVKEGRRSMVLQQVKEGRRSMVIQLVKEGRRGMATQSQSQML